MKSGESIIDELYSFQDKGGRDLALRPELTAPVIRMYVDQLQMKPKPLKLFYFGNCYRYDRPQKGRYREFMQAGCELIGTNNPEALAELIGLAYYLLYNSNVSDITLDIGNLNILKGIFHKMKFTDQLKKTILPLIDKELFDDVKQVLIENEFSSDQIDIFINLIQKTRIKDIESFFTDDEDTVSEIKKMKEILDLLKDGFGIRDFTLNLGIVRGLDYYTGMVFEIKAPKLGAEKQICGGGEYELIPLFNGRPTPTSGFALGFDRTILAMELSKVTVPLSRLDYYIIPVTDDMIKPALQLTMKLRTQGFTTDIDLMQRGIGKAMKYASNQKTKKTIIFGPDEYKNQMVSMKDMDSGEQQVIQIDKLGTNEN
jgi:histidyl-tRNA synthetase